MGTTTVVLVAVGAAAALAYFVGRRFTFSRFMRGRRPRPTSEMIRDLPRDVNEAEATDVILALGRCYAIDPELLRLEDSLASLAALDSWALGKGQEEFEDWLRERGFRTPFRQVITVGDLVTAAASPHTRDTKNGAS